MYILKKIGHITNHITVCQKDRAYNQCYYSMSKRYGYITNILHTFEYLI